MSMLSEIKEHPKRFYNTLGLYMAFICGGMTMGIVGPTLLDLRIACDTDMSILAYIVTGKASGYAVGSFINGFIYTRVDAQVAIAVGTLISGVIIIAIPFVRNVYLLIAVFFLLGSNQGTYESTINVFILDLWGKENPPFMQLLHFCYGLGALISPLYAKPFLVESEVDDEDKSSYGQPFHLSINGSSQNISQANSSSHSADRKFTADDLLIEYPYGINALAMFACCCFFILIRRYFTINPLLDPHPSRKSEQSCPHNESSTQTTRHNSYSTSNVCAKCQRVRRFTFTNHANSLSIVSNSSTASNLSTSAKVFNLTINSKENQVGGITPKRLDCLRGINSPNKNLVSSRVNSPFASPISSPIGSPFATPLFKPKFDRLRTQSVASGCSQCQTGTHECQVKKPLGSGEVKKEVTSDPQEKWKIFVVVLCGFFMHFYCATEMTFGSFIATFAVKSDLHMSKRSAAVLSSVFWASFTFYRLIMVFLVEFLGSRNSVLIDVFLCLLSNIFLVPFGDKYEWCLWTGAALMGIGLSAIFASIIGYIEEFMPVTSQIMAVFTITASVGQVSMPAIISPFMEVYPKALMWISLGYSGAMVAFFLVITLVCAFKLTGATKIQERTSESR